MKRAAVKASAATWIPNRPHLDLQAEAAGPNRMEQQGFLKWQGFPQPSSTRRADSPSSSYGRS